MMNSHGGHPLKGYSLAVHRKDNRVQQVPGFGVWSCEQMNWIINNGCICRGGPLASIQNLIDRAYTARYQMN